MKWLKHGFQTIVLLVAAGLLGWLLVANLEVGLPKHTTVSMLLASGLIFLILIGGISFGSWWLSRHGTAWLLSTFAGLTLLKLPLIASLKIQPSSDFWNYHTLAAFSAQGLTWKQLWQQGVIGNYVLFPHALNIANGFSLAAAFGGDNYFVSQLINIGCGLFDMLLIYWLVARWLSRQLGIAAALIFYCIPAYWLYGSLLNGGEPFFLTSVLLSMYALTRALVPLSTSTRTDQHLFLGLAVIATVVANMLRPIMAVWVIAVVMMAAFVYSRSNWQRWQPQYRQLLLYSGVVLALFVTATNLDSWFYGIRIAPSRVETLYSLATGTDPNTYGTYSAHLQASVNHELRVAPSLNQAYPQITRHLETTLQTNLTHIEPQLGSFANQKVQNFAREDYGYDWSLYNLSPHGGALNHNWFHWAPIIVSLAVIYWQGMLLLALLSILMGLWLQWRHHYLNTYLMMAALLFDGFTLTALPLEVQGRYHVILYLPIIMLLICGVAGVKLWWRQRHHHLTIITASNIVSRT